MAITTISQLMIPRIVAGSGLPSFANMTLNASGDKVAYVIAAPKAGDIEAVGFRVGTVGNNPDNGVRVSLQTVDLATGSANGTQSQFRDHTSALSSNTWIETGRITSDGTDTGTRRTVAHGELFAIDFDFVSFVASDSFQISNLSIPTGTYSQ